MVVADLTKKAIATLAAGGTPSGAETDAVAEEIMSGEATPAQIAAFITALRLRGETVDQIVAFTRVMREKAAAIKAPAGPILDTCGTGGDGAGTFNISTTAAFIAAGAGVVVAKHGNRGVSSACGSADVLTELGVRIDAPVEATARCLREAGIGFLFAPLYHAAMKHAIGPRREIGIRTIFNMLGPLSNPARATHQLIGVYDAALAGLFCQVLRKLGSRRALVVHGSDGLDEITTTGLTAVSELKADGAIESYMIRPEDFGLPAARAAELLGGSPADNARDMLAILDGAPGPKADVALLNAAAAIYVAEAAGSIAHGLERARAAVRDGAAKEKLEALRRVSND